MLIVGDDIIKKKFLKGADAKNIQDSSYYLTIGAVVPPDGCETGFDVDNPTQNFVLEPGAIATIVSKEVFQIDGDNVTALVTLRSSFTKQGLLALDVGLVDSGYVGPIGSVVINFSKDKVPLYRGDQFFRVIFISHDKVPEGFKFKGSRPKFSPEDYIKSRHSDLVKNFPSTFLNTNLLANNIREDLEVSVADQIKRDIARDFLVSFWRNYSVRILLGLIAFIFALFAGYSWVDGIIKERVEYLLKNDPAIIEQINRTD